MRFNSPQHKNKLFFVPFVGTHEIGMNMSAYCLNNKWLMVDFGLGFAQGRFPGIDILLPDITFLQEHKSSIVGLVLTHGHEDHIGAIPYLWKALGCPIYTSPFTANVLRAKLQDFGSNLKIPIKEIDQNTKLDLSPFSIELFGITHSVLETRGLMIRTSAGNVFHTGDWKLDKDPVLGSPTDEDKLLAFGDEGVLAVVCDSTNIFTPGTSGSEGDLAKSLQEILSKHRDHFIVLTTFSSNIARIYSIAKIAKALNKKVVLAGRSFWRLYNVALDSGYLDDIEPFLTPKEMKQFPKNEIIAICAGCQGEELAAVTKIANGQHPDIQMNKGDKIIFSSKIIPGNELKIHSLINKFCKKGVEVLTEKHHFVHVSGHPAREEVVRLYKLLRPQISVPVHGEARHLHEHCKLAESIGIPHTIEMENGTVIQLSKDGPKKCAELETGYLALDGSSIIDTHSPILKNRFILGNHGIVVVILVLNKENRCVKHPTIYAPGILDENNDFDGELVDYLIAEIRDSILVTKNVDTKSLRSAVTKLIKKTLFKQRKKEPQIIVHIERVNI